MTMRQAAGGAGDVNEPERGQDEQVRDPTGRRTPFVEGPTGPAPLTSELRGDPGSEGDRGGAGGAAAGAITGTALGGPVGGVVGAMAGGAIGTASVDGREAEQSREDNERRPDDERDRSR